MTEQNLVPKKVEVNPSVEAENISHFIDNFEESSTRLSPSIKREDLSIVKGVGPLVAQALYEGGIERVIELAKSKPEDLMSLKGIGLSKAQKLIENAKNQLKNKTLNGFSMKTDSHLKIENTSLGDSLQDINGEEGISNYKIRNFENDEDIEVNANFEDIKKDYSTFEANDISNQVIQPESNVQEESIDNLELSIKDIKLPIHDFISFTNETEVKFEKEKENLTRIEPLLGKEGIILEKFNQLEDKLRHQLTEYGFHIIEKTVELRELTSGIDIIAAKFVSNWSSQKKISNPNDLVLIIPIKISPLEGSLIVSKERIEYGALDKDSDFYVKRLPMLYVETLEMTEKAIRNNISKNGALLKILNQILGYPLSLKRTTTRKNLYFYSGNNQCEIIIEPIILSQNMVGFTEKLLPFAYHRNTNIHVLQLDKLSMFLRYIEKKNLLLESSTSKKSLRELHYKAESKLFKHLKFISPFIILTLTYFIIFLFQAYSFLVVMNKIALGLAILMGILLGYFMLEYFKNILEIQQEFSIPYYKRDLHLDNTSLKLINEDFSPILMEQFSYECLGKNSGFKIIEKVENQNTQNFLQEKSFQKKIKQTDLFEEEVNSQISENPGRSEERNELKQKYSSFLED
ncbi:MAG: helix-hairpin-helix domain-containing protein [Promethearchaeota archaeon]